MEVPHPPPDQLTLLLLSSKYVLIVISFQVLTRYWSVIQLMQNLLYSLHENHAIDTLAAPLRITH